MAEPKVIIVVLRRPNPHNCDEMRSDPFWEFGSFGCTGCHKENLMHPDKSELLKGARLAFAQGGKDGFRLVHLTSPIEIKLHELPNDSTVKIAEAVWRPAKMPFRYAEAPLIIKNISGNSDFPLLKKFIENANCASWEAKFNSKFRSRREPLDANITEEIIAVFEQKANTANPNIFARTYIEALPDPPNKPDTERKKTYLGLLHSTEDHKKCK